MPTVHPAGVMSPSAWGHCLPTVETGGPASVRSVWSAATWRRFSGTSAKASAADGDEHTEKRGRLCALQKRQRPVPAPRKSPTISGGTALPTSPDHQPHRFHGCGSILGRLCLWFLPFVFAAGVIAQEALPSELFGQFAFVPHRRQFRLTPSYQYGWADQYFDAAGQRRNLPEGQPLRQHTGGVTVEYGFAPYVSADLTLDAVSSRGPAASGLGGESTAGLGDTQFGLRWRLLDEDLKESEPLVPTLTLRAGGIAPGTYDRDVPFAPGPGAPGFETRLLMHDALGSTPFALYGDVGWRWLGGGVPDRFFGSAGMTFLLKHRDDSPWLDLSFGYAFTQTSGGGEIAENWSATDWRDLHSLQRGLQSGLCFTDRAGRRWEAFATLPLAGHNCAREMTVGVAVRIPFAKLPRRRS